MLCRQRPDLSDLSIRTQEGILVKNSKNISIKELIAEKAIYLVFYYPVSCNCGSRTKILIIQ